MLKHRNLIFTGLAIGGVIATVGTVTWGTLKANEILKANASVRDKIKCAWPYYVPAAAATTGTIAAIACNSYLNYKDVAAISAAAGYAIKNRKFLAEKIQEKFPKEYEDLRKSMIVQKQEPPFNLESVELTGNGDLLCIEGYSGRWFRSSEEAVRKAEEQFNELFDTNKYVCLNDFYKLLGIEETHFGFQWGWVNDPDWYGADITFENTLIDNYEDSMGKSRGEPVLVIDIYDYPMECWQEV